MKKRIILLLPFILVCDYILSQNVIEKLSGNSYYNTMDTIYFINDSLYERYEKNGYYEKDKYIKYSKKYIGNYYIKSNKIYFNEIEQRDYSHSKSYYKMKTFKTSQDSINVNLKIVNNENENDFFLELFVLSIKKNISKEDFFEMEKLNDKSFLINKSNLYLLAYNYILDGKSDSSKYYNINFKLKKDYKYGYLYLSRLLFKYKIDIPLFLNSEIIFFKNKDYFDLGRDFINEIKLKDFFKEYKQIQY